MARTKENKFQQLLDEISSTPDELLTRTAVKQIVFKHLAGYRVSCSIHTQTSHEKPHLAYSLIDQGLTRAVATSNLVERLGISRQWATTLVNKALAKKYDETVSSCTSSASTSDINNKVRKLHAG